MLGLSSGIGHDVSVDEMGSKKLIFFFFLRFSTFYSLN